MLCALASYLDAKANHGQWLVRIEDLDPPREQPGADQLILNSLRAHGLHWDGEVSYQNDRLELYASAMRQLQNQQQIFRCTCRRADLAAASASSPGRAPGHYPGHCRQADHDDSKAFAIRLMVNSKPVAFDDIIQGEQTEQLDESCGDFIIRRKDGLFAYQLAVAVDDAEQAISHVVRGVDLLDSTARQIHVLNCLGKTSPEYAHVPVLVDSAGIKLSKQTAAPAIDDRHASGNLCTALAQLGQPVPGGRDAESLDALLRFAVAHYSISSIPAVRAVPANAKPPNTSL